MPIFTNPHVYERGEICGNARDDKQQPGNDRTVRDRAKQEHHPEDEADIDEINFVENIVGRQKSVKSRYAAQISDPDSAEYWIRVTPDAEQFPEPDRGAD